MTMNKQRFLMAAAVAALMCGSNVAFAQRMEGGGGGGVSVNGEATHQGGKASGKASGTVGARGGMSERGMSERGSNARGAQGTERRSMTSGQKGSNSRGEQGSIRGRATGHSEVNERSNRSSREMTRDRGNDRSSRTEGRGEHSVRTEGRGERSFRNEDRGERSVRGESRSERPSTVGQGRTRVDRDVRVDRNVRINLNDRDRTRIREVIVRRNIPHARNIDFDLRVGTVIPRRVRLVSIPEEVVRIHPRFRRDRIFIANGEIVIVDPVTLRIIAVLAV